MHMIPLLQTTQPLFASTLKCAGPIFFLGLQASSVQTAMKIIKEKSVGKLSPIPFLCLLTNSIIWTMYGVLKKDLTVLIPNASGSLAGLGCALTYQRYSTQSNVMQVLTSIFIITGCIALAGSRQTVLLGTIGCILAIALSGSPLATIQTVIRDKSTDALPLTTSLVTWLNCISWFLYGTILAKDIMVSSSLSCYDDLCFICYLFLNRLFRFFLHTLCRFMDQIS